MDNYRQLLDNIDSLGPQIKALWDTACASESVFAPRGKSQYIQMISNTTNASILRIEAFRSTTQPFFKGNSCQRTFHSSGTTQSTRAKSHFSKGGLELYKAESLLSFAHVLKHFGFTDRNQGISLVPTPSIWPDSSLAQMLAWISEFWPTQYLKPEFNKCPWSQSDDKIWIIGTAFDFINQIDKYGVKPLPPGSIVFETGGTKGRSRELNRKEFYALLCDSFKISTDQIISEYGMGELACQAYDFATEPNQSLEDRHFRFPFWVKVSSTQGMGKLNKEGQGALVVEDPFRIDYPYPIQIQDFVKLNCDGSFHLKGRLPSAPLKGCSLQSEIVQDESKKSKQRPDYIKVELDITSNIKAHKLLTEKITEFLRSKGALDSLTKELKSETLAKWAIQDVLETIPQSENEWLDALRKAFGTSSNLATTYRRWLFIAPGSHDFACIQPLCLAYLSGLNVTYRISSQMDPIHGFTTLLLDAMNKLPGFQLTTIYAEKLDNSSEDGLFSQCEAVLAFGETKTLDEIRNTYNRPMVGFGDFLTITVLDNDAPESIRLLVKDAFSLGQKGCMSAKLVFVSNPKIVHYDLLRKILIYTKQLKIDLSPVERTMLDNEWHRYAQRSSTFVHLNKRQSFDEPVLALIKELNTSQPLSTLLPHCSLSLPIVLGKSMEEVVSFFKKAADLQLVTANKESIQKLLKEIKSIDIRPLGKANQPPWDGRHQRRGFFAISQEDS